MVLEISFDAAKHPPALQGRGEANPWAPTTSPRTAAPRGSGAFR